MQESELIRSAQTGQLEPFNQLVLIYQDRIYAQAYRLMGNQQEAEDAAQEAFLLAFRKLAGFHGGNFSLPHVGH